MIKNQLGSDYFNLSPNNPNNEESLDPVIKIEEMVKGKDNFMWVEKNPAIDTEKLFEMIKNIGDIYIENDDENGLLVEVKNLKQNYESIEELIQKFNSAQDFELILKSYKDHLLELYKNDVDS